MGFRIKSLFITAAASVLLAVALRMRGLTSSATFAVVLIAAPIMDVIVSRNLLLSMARLISGIEREARFRRISGSVPHLIAVLTPGALSHRLAVEQAVTHVATSLMTEKDPDPRGMLAVLAQALRADTAWILPAVPGGRGLDLAYRWPPPGTGGEPGGLTVDPGAIAWLWNALCNGESVVIPQVAALPAGASREREMMQEQGIRSAVCVPLSCAGETLGMMGFGDTRGARDWPEEDVRLLKAVCEMMAAHIKRNRSEEALRESEERYRFLVENQDEGIAILDLNEGFTFANPAAVKMFGSPPGGLVGRNLSEFTDPDSFNIILSNTKLRWHGLKTTYEIEIRASGGRKRTVLLTGSPRFDSHGRLIGTFGIFRDITEQKRAEARIRYLSFHDKLTGLYNRAYFEEELRRINGQRQMPLSVILGDVNGLKLVNDAFGHHEGDRILVEIAQVLKASCRREDVVARWGGDEFAIVLPRCAQKTAVEVCDRIRQSCSQCGRSPLRLSIALGAVTKEDSEESVSDILREAEDRMYRNKLLESKSTRSFLFHSLQQTLRERSHETEEHAQRLKDTAVRIGRMMGLSDSKMDELSLLAALHDIGKIAIPDSILLKPSGLSAEEWLTVRKHPEIGYRIAASSPEMAPIAEAILSHHERWDGTGYPQGLKGEQIPLISRIIAVADAYDAMTHRSRYREPVGRRAAIEEIRRNAGGQFDPEVVRAFLKAFDDQDALTPSPEAVRATPGHRARGGGRGRRRVRPRKNTP